MLEIIQYTQAIGDVRITIRLLILTIKQCRFVLHSDQFLENVA